MKKIKLSFHGHMGQESTHKKKSESVSTRLWLTHQLKWVHHNFENN